MENDDNDLRARFAQLAAETQSAAPHLSQSQLNAWRSSLLEERRQHWSFGMIAGLTAGAVGMLTIGLVLGASTGYASAEVVYREHGETVPPIRPGLAVLKNIPPLVFSCGSPARVAELPPSKPEQQGVPIIDLPTPASKSAEFLGGVLGVRQTANGGVVLNDAGHRQVKLFDSTLSLVSVLRDSMPGTSTSYGSRPAPMVSYLGDSALFGDPNAGSILLMAPSGQIARAIAPLGDEMVYGLTGPTSKSVDGKGRLLFQSNMRSDPSLGLARARIPDSAYLVRADLDARRADTLARLKSTGTVKLLGREGNGPLRFSTEAVPLTDDWAMLADGSIAIVRGHDYHIDWIRPDGSMTSSPKMPFDWKRITDEEKQRLIDSIRTISGAKLGAAMARKPVNAPLDQSGDQKPGPRRQVTDYVQGPAIPTEYVAPDLKDVFDFYPPIRTGALIPDLDGNLWILPTSSAQSKQGELVYDVVNAKGDFHRVRIPLGRSVVGFGRGGTVFLLSGDKTNGFSIEKTKLPSQSTR